MDYPFEFLEYFRRNAYVETDKSSKILLPMGRFRNFIVPLYISGKPLSKYPICGLEGIHILSLNQNTGICAFIVDYCKEDDVTLDNIKPVFSTDDIKVSIDNRGILEKFSDFIHNRKPSFQKIKFNNSVNLFFNKKK